MRRRQATPLIAIMLIAYGAFAATVITDNSPQLGLDLVEGLDLGQLDPATSSRVRASRTAVP